LSRKTEEGAAAIETSDTGVAIDEPIQCWIQSSRVKNGRGTEKREMVSELREGIRDKERVRESSTTERSSRKRRWLNNSRSDRKERGMSLESKRNCAKLGSDGEPSNSAV
jgi:hypothetical protein